ncbi:MAG TPA: Ig-like domain-containing protein, partial [Segetibacter sp.]
MKQVASFYSFLFVGTLIVLLLSASGCANIVPPSGGAKDTIPPILVAETPVDSAKNVTTKRFTFVFNEYVELDNALQNVLISPTPVERPDINSKLRTVTVRLRDSLEPNTTYSFNFGNAIKDINEGNVFKDFSYVFSTGNTIDVFTLSGKVVLAQTGKVDSTLNVMLYKNLDDSAVVKERSRYSARLDGQGNFTFRNLPAGSFALYAMAGTRYDDDELFAFSDKPVRISAATPPVNLFAYIETVRPAAGTTPSRTARDQNKSLRLSTNLEGTSLDLLNPLQLIFDRRIANYDSNKIVLTNKDFVRQTKVSIVPDTSATRFSILYNWAPNTAYNLIIAKDAFTDSSGATLPRADTISFTTKKTEDYGRVRIRLNNLDVSKNPVLLILQNDAIVKSAPLTQRDYIQKLFKPGEYDLRILYDTN